MTEQNSLAIFTRAALMLAEADTIQKAHELKNLALTAADFAKRKNMGNDAIRHCRSYALEAERKIGEMLIQTERAQGRRTDLVTESNQVDKPTLKELGLSKRESSEAQVMAALPREVFEEVKEGKKSKKSAVNEAKQEQKKEILSSVSHALPADKFDVILADPPWRYDFSTSSNREIENQYPTMDLEKIAELKIPAAADCVLFLWATSPKLPEALHVLSAWGFVYKTCMVWVKDKIGMGYYARQRHELLLIGTKGSPGVPDPATRPNSVIEAPRGKHSEKPIRFYEVMEAMFPGRKYLEMFSRKNRPGWETWGNENQ